GNNWIDAAKLDAVGAFMEGNALTWFENNHRAWHTFEEFEQAFLAKYHTEAKKHLAREKLLAYRQAADETVDDVIASLDRLFKTADVEEDKTKRTTLLRALNRDVALAVLRRTPINYAQMCHYAEEEAQAQASIDAHRPQRQTNDPTSRMDDLSKQIATLTLGVLETSETMTKLVEGVLRTRTNDQRENREPRETRNDNHRTNIRDDLRNRDREYRTRDQGRTIRCYRCGEPGHYANECMSERPQRRQEQERPSDRNGPVGRSVRTQDRSVNHMETHYLDLLETHYLDLGNPDMDDEEDELYAAATRKQEPAKPYASRKGKERAVDEHRALDKGIREIRDSYMDVVPGSIGAIPQPARREETVDNASTSAQPSTSTTRSQRAEHPQRVEHSHRAEQTQRVERIEHPHRVDHPRIEARKPIPIELMQGLPELTMKEVLSNTTVP
ncbi:hypothetical protein BGX34_006827, partial [Mortierella sp. NVP85]